MQNLSFHDQFTAVILCGGLGTRLAELQLSAPKCLIQVGDRPFLDYQIQGMEAAGIHRVVLCAGSLRPLMQTHFMHWPGPATLEYPDEPVPLGTGGALRAAMELVRTPYVLALNGDSYTHFPCRDFMRAMVKQESLAMVLASPAGDRNDAGLMLVDEQGVVTGFQEKSRLDHAVYVNAGIYGLRRDALNGWAWGQKLSLEYDVLPVWVQSRRLRAYTTACRTWDIGTPSRLQYMQSHWREIFEFAGTHKP